MGDQVGVEDYWLVDERLLEDAGAVDEAALCQADAEEVERVGKRAERAAGQLPAV